LLEEVSVNVREFALGIHAIYIDHIPKGEKVSDSSHSLSKVASKFDQQSCSTHLGNGTLKHCLDKCSMHWLFSDGLLLAQGELCFQWTSVHVC